MKLFNRIKRLRCASPEDEFAVAYETFAHEAAALMLRLQAVLAVPAPQSAAQVDRFLAEAVTNLGEIAAEAEQGVDAVAARLPELSAELRRFMLSNGVKRPARKASLFRALIILQICLLIEAGATATLLASDGYMSPTAALLTGTVFSGVNIGLGLACGFFGLRGAIYRAEARQPGRWDRLIRWAAKGFTVGSAAVMGLMHFAAARVRVTGDHSGIWDFEKASLLAALGDYQALSLLVIGALSSLLATREGWGTFDPIWGYSRVSKETEQRISEALDSSYDEGAAQIDEAHANASEALGNALAEAERRGEDYRAELEGLREDVSLLNTDLTLAAKRLKANQDAENKNRQYLDGVGPSSQPLQLDLASLRKLAIDPTLIPEPPEAPAITPHHPADPLHEAREHALHRLDAAYASASAFTTHPFT